MAKVRGEEAVLAAAHGTLMAPMLEQDMKSIQMWFKDVLEVRNLAQVSIKDLSAIIQPESLFERFAYRKINALGGSSDFLVLKG